MNQFMIDFRADNVRKDYEDTLLKNPGAKYHYKNYLLINDWKWHIPLYRADVCAILENAFSDKTFNVQFVREHCWIVELSFTHAASGEPRTPQMPKRAVPPETKTDSEVPIQDDLKTE